jgi:hypothetical protein
VTDDPDAGDTHGYTLLPGGDSADFSIVSNRLVVGPNALDFEAGATRSVTVRTTDDAGLFLDKTFVIGVLDVNEAPTDIALSGQMVVENAPNALIGNLTTSDPDAGDTFSYSLLVWNGEQYEPVADDGQFVIAGDQLFVGDTGLAYGPAYSVLIRTTDSGGLTFDKSLAIHVTSASDAPGEPDDTFGGDGLVTTDFFEYTERSTNNLAQALALDGGMVIAGSADVGIGDSTTHDLTLARLDVDGNPDPLFGDGGVRRYDFGGDERALEVGFQSDGRIVVCRGIQTRRLGVLRRPV